MVENVAPPFKESTGVAGVVKEVMVGFDDDLIFSQGPVAPAAHKKSPREDAMRLSEELLTSA